MMADHHSEATVNTNIPAKLVSDVEKALLSALGYQCEPADPEGNDLFFFKQESDCCLQIANPDLFLLQLETNYSDRHRPDWIIRLIRQLQIEMIEYLQSDSPNDEKSIEIDLDEVVVEAELLFQSILSKPDNTGSDAIGEIVIMGAYHCSKMQPDQFGGWVTRITRDLIETESTIDMLERLRKGKTNHVIEAVFSALPALSRLHILFQGLRKQLSELRIPARA